MMMPDDRNEYDDGEDDAIGSAVFLVGAGAEEGAWPPVTKAIEASFPNGQSGVDSGLANFLMAKLVAVQRAQHALQKDGAHGQADLCRLKCEIARRLDEAVTRGELRPRPDFLEVAQCPTWGRKVFLTTNWDASIKNALPNEDILHIHGSTSDPATLYLPSDYAYDPIHPECTRTHMLCAQDQCIEALWKATTIVIYGLSLDPLDGELAAICATGFRAKEPEKEKLEKIVIFDLQEKQKVLTDRVRWLLPTSNTVEIEFRSVKKEQ